MSFKFCTIMTLHGLKRSIASLMTLTLFQCYRCLESLNCLFCVCVFFFFFFLDSRLVLYEHCMVVRDIEKIVHNILLCDCSVYLREIINMFLVSWVSGCVKYMNIELCMMVLLWALAVHTTFSDLGHISRSQQCWAVLTEQFVFLSS